MEQVMYARGSEPWRVEFMQEHERRQEAFAEGVEQGREEGIEQGLVQGRAEAQVRIAELETELARYKNSSRSRGKG